jgi:hypothetical protein
VTAADPRDPLRNDLTACLALGLLFGAGFAVALGVTGGLAGQFIARLVVTATVRLTLGLKGGVPGGLAGGGLSGLVFGLVVRLCGHAWLRYSIAVGVVARDRRLPLRFGRFLNWAYQAGILRVAGNAYQFRHIELRDWIRSAAGPR